MPSLEVGELPARPVGKLTLTSPGGEVDTIELPTDHFIHAILIEVKLGTLTGGTSGNWNTDAGDAILKNIQVVGNGNVYLKDLGYLQLKQINIINKDVQPTGFHKIYFTDLKIPSKPLPSWVFTSLQLRVKAESVGNLNTGDRTGWTNTYAKVSVIEQPWNGEDIRKWPALYEKVHKTVAFGTNTGRLEFLHERAYRVFGYLYEMDDDGTRANDVFDVLSIIGRTKEREFRFKDEVDISLLRAQAQATYQNALDTGYFYVDFAPKGFDTSVFTSLKSIVETSVAGTNKRLTVVERYLMY
jgi:hypothetical protein